MNLKTINYYIFMFTLIFGVIFYNSMGKEFRFIDEAIIAFLIIYWCTNSNFQLKNEFLFFIIIALTYLLYSLMYPHNIEKAIWMDFFSQIKPYLTFYCIYQLDFTFFNKDKSIISKFCLFSSLLILPYGLYYFGHPRMGIFYIPAHFATMMEILGITYLAFSKKEKKDIIISILIISIGVLSLRAKLLGFLAIYLGILLYWDPNKKYKIFTFKNLIILSIFIGFALYLTWDKINFYFIIGSSKENMMARPYMYYMAWNILHDFPFMGTGLGSYASYASSVFYSPLYYQYGMIDNYEIGKNQYVVDAFFPCFTQFGLLGITLFVLFWKKRYDEIKELYKFSHNTIVFKLSILIIIFFAIESLVDNTILQNRGTMMMMIFAILLKKDMSLNTKAKNSFKTYLPHYYK